MTANPILLQKKYSRVIECFAKQQGLSLDAAGGYNFTDDAPPQPFLPIVAYWDDYDKVPYAFPHVYDYMVQGRYCFAIKL